MNLKSSCGALLALGIGAVLAAGLPPVVTSAQTPPRQLPATPDRAAPAPNDRAAPAPDDRPDPRGYRGYDRRANRFEDRLERRLDFLHSELRITPQQEQLWSAFAGALRSEAQAGRDRFADRGQGFRRAPPPRPGIVERLERRQQGLEEQSAYYDRLLTALRPLYAALNDDQRRAADEMLFAPGRDDRFGPRGWRRYGFDRDYR